MKVAFQSQVSTFTGPGKGIERDFQFPTGASRSASVAGSIHGPATTDMKDVDLIQTRCAGPQPLVDEQVPRVQVRDPDLNPCAYNPLNRSR